jgi:hypothetical protein
VIDDQIERTRPPFGRTPSGADRRPALKAQTDTLKQAVEYKKNKYVARVVNHTLDVLLRANRKVR